MHLKAPERLLFEGYEVDPLRWTLMWPQEPVPLSRKTFDLLLYLIEHRDRVISKIEDSPGQARLADQAAVASPDA